MGLFDKLFRRKKPKKTRPPAVSTQQSRVTKPTGGGRPVKGPPRTQSQPGSYRTVRTHSVSSSPYYQPQTTKPQLDEESRRILEASLAKIPAPGTNTSTVSSPVRQAKQVSSSTRVMTPPTKRLEVSPKEQKTVTQPPITKGAEPKKPLEEDMSGEEELFRKLIQMDKQLQQKIVARKEMVKGAPTPTAKTTEKRGLTSKDLRQKELELKKYEAKLREKERKLQEMENLNKTFTQMQDDELEQFSNFGSGAGTVAVSGGAGLAAGLPTPGGAVEGEEVSILESEDFYQPLKNLTFNNFIVGPSNRFAHDVALSVAKAPADAYNPLFIYSEVGLGKTHLLCAIGNYIKGKNPSAQIVYVSSEKFTNELLDFLRLGEMEKFRTKYRNVDVLLIDDIQFIGGQEGTQEEFFHTFNALYNAHKQIVITSDRPPKNIAHLKDRLRSRFEGGLIVNIKLPDLGTRTMILHEKAEKDGIYIPDEIINYISAKVKSNVRTLIGVLNRIVAHSSLSDRELDKSLVDDVLKDVVDEGIDISGI